MRGSAPRRSRVLSVATIRVVTRSVTSGHGT